MTNHETAARIAIAIPELARDSVLNNTMFIEGLLNQVNNPDDLKARRDTLEAGIRGALHCLQDEREQYEHPEAAACDWLEDALNPNKQDEQHP